MLFLKICLVVFAFLSKCPLDIHLSILRTLCLKSCPHYDCIIVVFNPHPQHFGDFVSKFGFFPGMNQPLETVVRKNGETPGVKCRNVMNLYESRAPWTFINAIPVPLEYIICSHLDILQRPSFPIPASD